MMNKWFEQNKIPVIFAALGLILAILFLTVGFLKTLLLLIFTALGRLPWLLPQRDRFLLINFKSRGVSDR